MVDLSLILGGHNGVTISYSAYQGNLFPLPIHWPPPSSLELKLGPKLPDVKTCMNYSPVSTSTPGPSDAMWHKHLEYT
ncbi:hypothetical protein PanWU01x14_238400 [Parasponia andersonii]|uniref:Uncharacterized protein n=1 Tax=Parasponia andersonii TaxID=3476 RepID=A0A2P5BHM8_PARAD|nr:hypothetical protein PanWU01x14_238400 [Parasponia andersonii]